MHRLDKPSFTDTFTVGLYKSGTDIITHYMSSISMDSDTYNKFLKDKSILNLPMIVKYSLRDDVNKVEDTLRMLGLKRRSR